MSVRAVLFSAGQGSRLGPLTNQLPKCLLEVAGLSILDRQLDALAAAGVNEVTVVTGFQEEKVLTALARRAPSEQRVRTIYNPFYSVADNLGSAWIARSEVRGPCLLLNGDTIVSPELITQLLRNARHPATLASDIKSAYDDDDMRMIVHGDTVTAIGKTLPVNGGPEAIGLLLLGPDGAEAFARDVDAAIREPAGPSRYYLTVIQRMADRGLVGRHMICGHAWCEIDFPADLLEAEALFANPTRLSA